MYSNYILVEHVTILVCDVMLSDLKQKSRREKGESTYEMQKYYDVGQRETGFETSSQWC